jgi:cyclase
MLTRRIIACLDVRDGEVVKGRQFVDLMSAGDPAELACRYGRNGIDEVMFLDITATVEKRGALADVVRRTADTLFIPLGVGGGVRSLDDAARLFDAGADKVAINSAALADPGLITAIAGRYGTQAVVVAVDAQRESADDGTSSTECCRVFAHGGRTRTPREAVEWAQEAESRGAGELLLTSIDRDGTRDGFDVPLTSAVASAVQIPVIASGGAGEIAHFTEIFASGGADAALAASVFHFGTIEVPALKDALADAGVPVRRLPPC